MEQITEMFGEPSPGQNAPDNTPPSPPTPPSWPDPMTDSHYSYPYGDYTIDTEYVTDHGLRLLPVGVEGADAVLVKIFSAKTTKIVQWSSCRNGAKPYIPHPDTGDPNEVLVKSSIYPANVMQERTNLVCRCSGVYTYHLKKAKIPGTVGTKYPMGVSSAETADGSTRFYDDTDFSTKPLDASQLRDGGTPPRQPGLNQVIQG